MKPSPSIAEAPVTTAPQPQPVAWLFALPLLMVAITVAILGSTLTIPFFTIDDSDVLRKSAAIVDSARNGKPLFVFEPGSHANRRYYPGYAVYMSMRLAVLGKNSVIWHAWHLLVYSFVGIGMALAARKLTGKVVPGVVAYAMVIATGTLAYESNWFNFVFMNTFEPWLLVLWTAGCCLLAIGRIWALVLGTLCLLWSIISKENAFMVTLPVACASGALFFWKPEWFGPRERIRKLAIPCAIVAISSAIYVLVLRKVIPSDKGYAGTETLVRNPVEWWKSTRAHFENWVDASWYLIPAGVLHLVVRVIASRPWKQRDAWLLLLVFAAFCQLGSLLIWPSTSMRLSQPAYAALLLVSCCEVYLFLDCIRGTLRGRWTLRESIGGAALAVGVAALLISRSTLSYPHFMTFVKVLGMIWAVTTLAFLAIAYRRSVSPARWAVAGSLGFLMVGTILIILLAGINISSYPTLVRTTEGPRQLLTEYLTRDARPGARVAWIIPPSADIFAWSCDVNMEVLHGRADVIQGPAGFALEKGPLQKGDYFVCYGASAQQNPMGAGRLSQHRITTGGYISPLGNLKDIMRFLVEGPKSGKPLTPIYSEGSFPVYKVQSDSWQFDPGYLARFTR